MTSALASFAVVLIVVDAAVLLTALGWLRRSSQAYALKNLSARHTLETLRRIHELTSNVAGRVEDHLSRVEEISRELASMQAAPGGMAETAVVDAVSRIVDMNRELAGQLVEAKRKLARQADAMAGQAVSARADLATGLPNRRAFDDELGRRFAQWQDQQVPLSVVLIDVDQLTDLQSRHGPESVDELLRGVGQRLADTMRATDLVARYGPDQFAMLLPGTSLAQARSAVERFRTEIAAQPYFIEGEQVKITISEGVANAMPGDDLRTLTRRTTAALIASRKAGRNCAHSHDGHFCEAIAALDHSGEVTASFPRDLLRLASRFKAEPAAPHTDALTGLANRRAFFETLRRRIAGRHVENPHLTLMLVDVDGMRQLNQAHGHLVGDMILRVISQIVRTATRSHCDLAARYEGSKFAVILIDMPPTDTLAVAERVRRAVGACKLMAEGRDLKVTVSIGLAEWTLGTDAVALIKSAEQALNAAKGAGRNRIQTHSPYQQSTAEHAPPASRPLDVA